MLRFISFVGFCLINLIGKTLRVREVNRLPWKERHLVFAFWHGEQFIPFYRHRRQNVTIMSSQSRDGEIQSGILSLFGYNPVRGSSTRGGEKALVESIRRVRKGANAAFAVDGPKGPQHQVKPGIIYLAQKTGTPIIPASAAARRFRVFSKAWDKYELPRLFNDAVVVYGTPIPVGENDRIEDKQAEVQTVLEELSRFTHTHYWSDNLEEYLHNHPRPKILIVQPSRIGDVIFSLPTAAALRKRFPKAWIGWFVDERCAPVLQGCPDIDEIVIFDRSRLSVPYLLKLYRRLHAENIDVSIDLHGLAKSALMVLLAGAKHRIASSSTNGMREFSDLISKEIKPPTPKTHCVERHLAVAHRLGAPQAAPEYHIAVGDADGKNVEELLRRKGAREGVPLVAVHPGGGWLSRRWNADRFAALIERLQKETGVQVVLVGGKEGGAGEKGLNEEIISRVPGGIIDTTGQTNLKELAALLLKSKAFVANEAGPLHLAMALGVPSVALLGPTDPGRTGPFGGNVTIVRHAVECQPCRNRSCESRKCMELITVDEVFEAVKAKMAANA